MNTYAMALTEQLEDRFEYCRMLFFVCFQVRHSDNYAIESSGNTVDRS